MFLLPCFLRSGRDSLGECIRLVGGEPHLVGSIEVDVNTSRDSVARFDVDKIVITHELQYLTRQGCSLQEIDGSRSEFLLELSHPVVRILPHELLEENQLGIQIDPLLVVVLNSKIPVQVNETLHIRFLGCRSSEVGDHRSDVARGHELRDELDLIVGQLDLHDPVILLRMETFHPLCTTYLGKLFIRSPMSFRSRFMSFMVYTVS